MNEWEKNVIVCAEVRKKKNLLKVNEVKMSVNVDLYVFSWYPEAKRVK